jgi:hypothetical protein
MSDTTTIPNDIIGRINSFLSSTVQLNSSHVSSQWRHSLQTSLEANYDYYQSLTHYPPVSYHETLLERKSQKVFSHDATVTDFDKGHYMKMILQFDASPPFYPIPNTIYEKNDNVLICGTVAAIVEHLVLRLNEKKVSDIELIREEELDTFVQMIMKTYQSIEGLNYQNFLLILIDQYITTQNEFSGVTDDDSRRANIKRRLSLLDVMYCWIRNLVNEQYGLYYSHTEVDQVVQSISYLTYFLEEISSLDQDSSEESKFLCYLKTVQIKNLLHTSLKNAAQKRTEYQFKSVTRTADDVVFDCQDLLDLPLDVLADQLTVFQFESIRAIKLPEYCGVKWRKQKALCPNIISNMNKFGQVADWIAGRILEGENPEDRVQVLKKFLYLCRYLESRRNFQTLFAVVGGITSASVFRLHHTFALLTDKEHRMFQDVRELVSLSDSFARFRTQLDSCTSLSCIPYMGFVLSQLKWSYETHMGVFSEECRANTMNGKDMCYVNLFTLKEEYDILYQMDKWMNVHTCYSEEGMVKYDHIQQMIQRDIIDAKPVTQQALFRQSLKLEPRPA